MAGKGEAMKPHHVTRFGALLCTVIVLIGAGSNHAHAATCEEQTKECLTYTGTELESCLHRASSSSNCKGTPLGEVITKRSQLSPGPSSNTIEGPAFLGPQIIDKKCISNFDTELSAGLIKGTLSSDNLEALSISLDQCTRSYAPDITRP
jgi:hypothetical protein